MHVLLVAMHLFLVAKRVSQKTDDRALRRRSQFRACFLTCHSFAQGFNWEDFEALKMETPYQPAATWQQRRDRKQVRFRLQISWICLEDNFNQLQTVKNLCCCVKSIPNCFDSVPCFGYGGHEVRPDGQVKSKTDIANFSARDADRPPQALIQTNGEGWYWWPPTY